LPAACLGKAPESSAAKTIDQKKWAVKTRPFGREARIVAAIGLAWQTRGPEIAGKQGKPRRTIAGKPLKLNTKTMPDSSVQADSTSIRV
jgi:hypothetical protein